MQRMYANIRLPVDVYTDGKFKMIYDQMQISMISDPKWKDIINEKVEEMKEDVIERLRESEEKEEIKEEVKEEVKEEIKEQEKEEVKEDKEIKVKEPETEEIKIYATDYPLNQNKKRLNTTFRKNIKRNQITKKNYVEIPISIS